MISIRLQNPVPVRFQIDLSDFNPKLENFKILKNLKIFGKIRNFLTKFENEKTQNFN